jgi:hypothetical protein
MRRGAERFRDRRVALHARGVPVMALARIR